MTKLLSSVSDWLVAEIQRSTSMASFVTLSCPSCGGQLQITEDVERFACAHCGREHIVKRGGGIVSLAPIAESLDRIQRGTDATAIELRIRRLRDEARDAESEFREIVSRLILNGYTLDVKSALNEIGELSFLRSLSQDKQDVQKIMPRLTSANLQRLGEKYARGLFFGRTNPRKLEVMNKLKQLRERIEEREAEIESLRGQVN